MYARTAGTGKERSSRAGLTATEVVETVIHTVQYVGFPRALNALRVVTDRLVEMGVEVPGATVAAEQS